MFMKNNKSKPHKRKRNILKARRLTWKFIRLSIKDPIESYPIVSLGLPRFKNDLINEVFRKEDKRTLSKLRNKINERFGLDGNSI